jgi:hypothetical protein
LDSKADAAIYLTEAVARVMDRDFLDDVGQVTLGQSRAFNGIGVMARIDQRPDVLFRLWELAPTTARQLEQRLSTVLPVPAVLEFALNRLGANARAGLRRLAAAFWHVPAEILEGLLASEDLYRVKACPVSVIEREELLDDKIPRTVFTTIPRQVASAGAGADLDRVVQELAELAEFGPLKDAFERRFFQRAANLRCFGIVNDARAILSAIRVRELPKRKLRDREKRAQRERFLAFVR